MSGVFNKNGLDCLSSKNCFILPSAQHHVKGFTILLLVIEGSCKKFDKPFFHAQVKADVQNVSGELIVSGLDSATSLIQVLYAFF